MTNLEISDAARYSGLMEQEIFEAFAERISIGPQHGECWGWKRKTNGDGYSYLVHHGISYKASRLSYEIFHGEIAEGMQIDHVCRNRECVNPDHLESVTQTENLRRRVRPGRPMNIKCIRGHEYVTGNVSFSPDGKTRYCKQCRKDRAMTRRAQIDVTD